MEFRKLLGYILCALLLLIATGCNGKLIETGAEKPVRTDGDENVDVANTPDLDKYKDKAVVIDTVIDIFREPDLSSERVTQAVFNQPVTLLEEKENWCRVEVVDGYTGWLRTKFIDRDCTSIMKESYLERAVVISTLKTIYTNPERSVPLIEVVMGTELFIINKASNIYQVALPGKATGWIDIKDIITIPAGSTIPKTTAGDFTATAQKFKGVQYLWGGVSARGIDCSGLTYICARINGIYLPRDADQQFEFIDNAPEGMDNIKPGDLVFFSSDEELSDISHVGIYVGDNSMLHAGKTNGSVFVSSINTDYYKRRFKGIRRLFD